MFILGVYDNLIHIHLHVCTMCVENTLYLECIHIVSSIYLALQDQFNATEDAVVHLDTCWIPAT